MDVDGDAAGRPADIEADPTSPHPSQASPHEVTLVAAAELHEKQRWQPTALHPGPAFKTVEWSADGTAVIASTASKSILTYVLPTDLLSRDEEDDEDTGDDKASYKPMHRLLTCHGRLRFGIAPASLAPAPYFSLAAPWSQTVLVGFRDRPIQLYPLFPPEGQDGGDDDDNVDERGIAPSKPPQPLASYSLIKHETEAYLPPMALLWPAPGNHFIVGTKSLIALFDSSRTSNDPPLLRVPTVTYTGGGFALGLKGMVSALAAGPEGSSQHLTAAGTWTRGVGLYDLTRSGGVCAAHWKVSDDAASSVSRGDGVVQLLWSPCGRYLVVNERKSEGLLVYDVRGSGKLLCTLAGRSARSTQPIRCSVYGGNDGKENGFELWSGTDSGGIVVYEGVGQREGVVEPSWHWQAHGRTTVGGTAIHSSGSVVATCSSSLPVVDRDDDDEVEEESESESDDDRNDDSSKSSDDSESLASLNSTSSRGQSRTTVSEPSLNIWSLLSLKAGSEEH
ncbi:hypothetical protein SBRCBS47491_003406 [Sporothrix bragantina]|uniref:WD repeat-containing protein n=1 Tax=Sporothrix bragantina TaxID=671064 RepID=A0ABP0BF58_9PEZI